MSASVDLFARLRLPHKLVVDANQAAGLQLRSNALELLARAFGIAVEHAFALKLLAPSVELHDHGSGRQLQACGCWYPAAGGAFVERGKG